ncbi:MAG: DUF6624 domain-containing protein [Chitinophagaceae bacterium]
MKNLFLLFFLAISFSAQAQGTSTSYSKGDKLRDAGNLKGAIIAYKNDLEQTPNSYNILYNLACALAVDSQKDAAFHYLNHYLKIDTDGVTFDMFKDPDFYSLYNDPRWKLVEQDRMKWYQKLNNHPIKDEDYALLLMRLGNEDQHYRGQIETLTKEQLLDTLKIHALWVLQGAADERNQKMLSTEVAKKGWPKISVVGKDGAIKAFFIVQHSNLAMMKKYLPIIKKLCDQKEAIPEDYALLYDRVQTMQSKPQLYGSQVFRQAGKNWEILPIADESGLAARRRKMGLEPMEEYVASWGIKYIPKEDKRAIPRRTLASFMVDTVFKQGQRILKQEKYFTSTRQGDFP